MRTDAELIQEYAETKRESAFQELVERHLNLVYSTALRLVAGDAHLAQDVAQSDFSDLARKAKALHPRLREKAEVLSGWPLLTGPARSAVAGAGAGGPASASVPNRVRTPVGIPSSP